MKKYFSFSSSPGKMTRSRKMIINQSTTQGKKYTYICTFCQSKIHSYKDPVDCYKCGNSSFHKID